MSDIIEMAKDFKDYAELKNYSDKQFQALKNAAEQIFTLKKEVEHLKTLLASTTQLIGSSEPKVEKIILTPEESLIEEQIDIIRNRSFGRELTLEDTKKLDLLIKNKRLAKEQSTTIITEKKRPDKKNLSPSDLARIAIESKDEQL